jgi:serine/threonine-protein kinase
VTTHDDDRTEVAAPSARRRRETNQPTAATEVMPPARTASGTTGPSTRTSAANHGAAVSSPLEALRLDEVARTRRLLPVVLSVSSAAAIALLFIEGGDPTAELLLYIGIGLSIVSSLWMHSITRDEGRAYTDGRVALAWAAPTLTIVAAVNYFGAFSPAPILMVLAIYLISLGRNRATALLVFGVCAGGQAVMGLLSITEVTNDPGLIHADYLGFREQLIGQILVQVVLAGTFFSARSSRRAALLSLTELERAVRGLAQREAMLHEARADLARAMQIGGAGKFTEQQVGSFRLGVVIGRGAMGEVYDARHVDTDEEAAVKLLHPNVVGQAGYLERFLREVEAANAVASPHIVRVLEVGDRDPSLPYLAMERLHGHDLAHYLRTRRRLGRNRILQLVSEVGAGIEAAGNGGIVHRDIKPQNLFLHKNGKQRVWKILDFGVSKLGGHGGTLTQGHVVGTPGYMAPEQAQGKDVDSRADLYALAAITYRAVTGHPPFQGKDTPTTLYKVVFHMPRQPSELVQLHPDVDAVIAIAIAKNPDDRFFRADELHDALAAAWDGNLDEMWRRKGQALVETYPWGTGP